jgi:hypothetical protein
MQPAAASRATVAAEVRRARARGILPFGAVRDSRPPAWFDIVSLMVSLSFSKGARPAAPG